jgi:hypothetical protein
MNSNIGRGISFHYHLSFIVEVLEDWGHSQCSLEAFKGLAVLVQPHKASILVSKVGDRSNNTSVAFQKP